MREGRRESGRQSSAAKVRRPDRALGLVGSEERSLIRSLPQLRRDLIAIVRTAIDAAAAPGLLDRALGDEFVSSFLDRRRLHLIAAGKPAGSMAAAFTRTFEARIGSAMATGTERPARLPDKLQWYAGGHPAPNAQSLAAGLRALEIAREMGSDEVLVVLLSGGASALLVAPAGDVSLDDKSGATRALLARGAEIHALNAVRKHLSAVKGGWLAAAARGTTLALAISDVMDDDPSAIGSGPTVPDATTFRTALEAVDRYAARESTPPGALRYLERGARGEVPETPKPGDARLARAVTRLIGTRRDALDGARRAAERLGYETVVRDEPVTGEAREAAHGHAEAVRRLAAGASRPFCVLSAGETTVRVVGRGKGGRNQEFALALLTALPAFGPTAVAASIGTDGVDGPTDAAGAIVDTTTLERARGAGLTRPDEALADNDAYRFFAPLGDLIRLGPTDTNVGDLQVVLVT